MDALAGQVDQKLINEDTEMTRKISERGAGDQVDLPPESITPIENEINPIQDSIESEKVGKRAKPNSEPGPAPKKLKTDEEHLEVSPNECEQKADPVPVTMPVLELQAVDFQEKEKPVFPAAACGTSAESPQLTDPAPSVEKPLAVPNVLPKPHLVAFPSDEGVVLYWDFHHVPDDLIGRINSFEVFFHKQMMNEDVPWKKCIQVFARAGPAQVSLKGFTQPGRYAFYVAALDSLNGHSAKSDTVHVTIQG